MDTNYAERPSVHDVPAQKVVHDVLALNTYGLLFPRPGPHCHDSIGGTRMTIDDVDLISAPDLTFHETIFIGKVEALVVHGYNGDEFFRGARRFD